MVCSKRQPPKTCQQRCDRYIERWLQRTLIKAHAEHQPKPKAAQTKKTAPVGYTITWRALFFPDNRIFYKAYS